MGNKDRPREEPVEVHMAIRVEQGKGDCVGDSETPGQVREASPSHLGNPARELETKQAQSRKVLTCTSVPLHAERLNYMSLLSTDIHTCHPCSHQRDAGLKHMKKLQKLMENAHQLLIPFFTNFLKHSPVCEHERERERGNLSSTGPLHRCPQRARPDGSQETGTPSRSPFWE